MTIARTGGQWLLIERGLKCRLLISVAPLAGGNKNVFTPNKTRLRFATRAKRNHLNGFTRPAKCTLHLNTMTRTARKIDAPQLVAVHDVSFSYDGSSVTHWRFSDGTVLTERALTMAEKKYLDMKPTSKLNKSDLLEIARANVTMRKNQAAQIRLLKSDNESLANESDALRTAAEKHVERIAELEAFAQEQATEAAKASENFAALQNARADVADLRTTIAQMAKTIFLRKE